jgi:cobalt-zinc-cadmium efflux system outer membrane protein
MRHQLTLSVLAFLLCTNASAQSTIENVLSEIGKNNKTIQATAQYYDAQNLGYRIGLAPNNPTVEYDFMKGSPANAGNQHDFIIAQQFDFPTAYIKRSQLAKTQAARSQFEVAANRQQVLLEAKKACIALVFHNKLDLQLTQQIKNTEKLLADFQNRLDRGEGNILDVNKARLQLLQIRKQWQQNRAEMAEFNTRLASLNGGVAITFTDTVYPPPPPLPEFTQLETEVEAADPLRKSLEQDRLITQKTIALNKSLWLPKMAVGYHYQGILGQTYNGIHTGMSIPLWENRHTVKQQQSNLLYNELNLENHRIAHFHHIKAMHERTTSLSITLEEYRSIFASLHTTALLNKALALGEITTIHYFMEINYLTEAQTNFLQTEMEYHQTLAELYKYLL